MAALEELGPDAGTVFTPLAGEADLITAGVLGRSMVDLERDWRTRLSATFGPLGLTTPPATNDPDGGRTDHAEPFRWLWQEFTAVRRSDPGATW